MAKSVFINIQIDEVQASDLAHIEEMINAALEDYKRKRITYNLSDQLGPPLPLQESE